MAGLKNLADFVHFPTSVVPSVMGISRVRKMNKRSFFDSVPPVGQFMHQPKLHFLLPIETLEKVGAFNKTILLLTSLYAKDKDNFLIPTE